MSKDDNKNEPAGKQAGPSANAEGGNSQPGASDGSGAQSTDGQTSAASKPETKKTTTGSKVAGKKASGAKAPPAKPAARATSKERPRLFPVAEAVKHDGTLHTPGGEPIALTLDGHADFEARGLVKVPWDDGDPVG